MRHSIRLLPRETPDGGRGERKEGRNERPSFVQQIRSQVMMCFLPPGLGGVPLNSLHCSVSFPDADFRSFV